MSEFIKDPDHWLRKLSPREWIRAALGELSRAEAAYERRDGRGGLAGAKRAAGMALNGVLIAVPNETWGRTYVDHVAALARDTSAPSAVQDACQLLLGERAPGSSLVSLHSKGIDQRVIEAARTVLAHAYAIVVRYFPDDEPAAPDET